MDKILHKGRFAQRRNNAKYLGAVLQGSEIKMTPKQALQISNKNIREVLG